MRLEVLRDRRKAAQQQAQWGNYWAGKYVGLADEHERILRAIAKESNDIEQMIAELFPEEFPRFECEECRGAGWVVVVTYYPPFEQESCPKCGGTGYAEEFCVGDHVPVTMVMKLIEEYKNASNRT